jgi:hypothetical protein
LSSLVQDQPYLETTGSGNAVRIRLKGQPAAKATTEKRATENRAPKKAAAKKTTPKKAAEKQTADKTAEKAPEPPRPVVTKRTRTSRRAPATDAPGA